MSIIPGHFPGLIFIKYRVFFDQIENFKYAILPARFSDIACKFTIGLLKACKICVKILTETKKSFQLKTENP